MIANEQMSLSELLDQDEIWIYRDSEGILATVRLDQMSLSHLENLRAWFLDRAPAMHSAALLAATRAAAMTNGSQAEIELDREAESISCRDPESWMRETELFEAIDEALAYRINESVT